MIYSNTKLKIIDNGGLTRGKTLGILKKKYCKTPGTCGDFVVFSSKKLGTSKKKVYFGLLVSTKKFLKRQNGHYVRAKTNNIITFETMDQLKGSRSHGVAFEEVRYTPNSKISLLKIKTI
jgi:ribosomal protein L14